MMTMNYDNDDIKDNQPMTITVQAVGPLKLAAAGCLSGNISANLIFASLLILSLVVTFGVSLVTLLQNKKFCITSGLGRVQETVPIIGLLPHTPPPKNKKKFNKY